MKKLITIFSLTILFKTSSAQYFIPLFNPTIDTMFSCTFLLNDSTHHYLDIATRDSSLNKSYLFAYRDNVIESTTFPSIDALITLGCTTDSGPVAIYDEFNHDLYKLDSLTVQSCFYGFCNVSHVDAMVSKNDTIYYDDNIASDEWVVANTPGGLSLLLGEATGGSGISDLEFYNGYLYASGTFTAMNGNPACKYICWWDGSTWHPLNNLTQMNTINLGIDLLLIYNNQLYMTGGFDLINGVQTTQVASYDGTNWFAHPFQGTSAIQNWVVYHNKIWMYGALFDTLGNHQTIGSYDGSSFDLIENTTPIGTVISMAVFNDTLYIGGKIRDIGNIIPCHNVVKFVDNSFSSFAPVGTKWWYNSSDTAYKYYEVARDTFIMHTANYYGYNCRKITGEQHLNDSTVTQLQPMYVFGDTNRVMYYNNYRGRFVPLYNFNVSIGDTLTYYTPQPQTIADTTFRVVVDSITLLNIQGSNCKRVWSTPLDGWSFGNDGYVQLVGGMGSMLPQLINYYNNEGPLRCYEDTSVFYHYLVTVNCEQLDTATGIEQLTTDNGQLIIFPNPVSETVTVMLRQAQHDIQEIVISNLLGEIVQSSKYKVQRPSVTININKLPRGIYLLRVQTNDGWRVGKVLKE